SGLSLPRLKPPVLGLTSSSRWMVLASKPVASVMRLAARSVGAHSKSFAPFADRMRRMALTRVGLPTPGPPVVTRTLDGSASMTADLWLSANTRPVRCSNPGDRLVRIDPRPGQLAIPKLQQPVGDAALRPVQACQENAESIAHPVGNNRTVGQFEVERSADQILRDFEELLGKRHELVRGQAAMTFIHRLGQRKGDAGAYPDQGGLIDAEL